MKKKLFTLLFTAIICNISATTIDVSSVEVERGEAIVHDTIQPIISVSSSNEKYSLSIGGNINMRASYDFNGAIVYHPDFITSLIPTPGVNDAQRRFSLDATTSRVEVKGRAKTEKYGDVELCLNMDFRGGSADSYTPRVRLAYISVANFVVGRNFTTFCDMGSAAPNIDFQGPSVCPYIYTTQIRYARSFKDDRLTVGVAMEYNPYESSSLSAEYDYQQQYIPSIPAYVQYAWGEQNSGHIRLTGLYKSIPLYNITEQSTLNLSGWGAQLSGSIGVCSHLKLYYSGTCGEGITGYMQDSYASGLDVTMSTGANPTPTMTFMYGWQAAGLVQITDRMLMSAGYSEVNIEGDASRFVDSDYRRGEYLFANLFYSLTPRIQLAAEYLWGSRTNNNSDRGTANRINTMIQYNF
ncbi:MAG: DcaP family trimeric outer membrane transporter [Rikenellaceae bacterium]